MIFIPMKICMRKRADAGWSLVESVNFILNGLNKF